jgi:hypothetical protein
MNMVNASTGFSPLVLKTGRSPRLLPPLLNNIVIEDADGEFNARRLIETIEGDVQVARDCMLAAKISQAHHANRDRIPDPAFKVGDRVMLTMAKRRREYMQAKDGRVAKFMARWDGPYEVLEAYPDTSTYKLQLPPSSKQTPVFHVSQLQPHHENDPTLFPARELKRPGPIITAEGSTEYFIDHILDERPRGRGRQYLVRWLGYGPESDLWLPRSELLDTEALVAWENLARRA